MNYDDLYLLKLIKKLQSDVAALASILGAVQVQIQNLTTGAAGPSLILTGTADPNTAGVTPANVNAVTLYIQTVDGVPTTIWAWSVANQDWR